MHCIISIHAPAKGATSFHSHPFLLPLFQSTLPRRERPISTILKAVFLFISIHAPAKGATMEPVSWKSITLFQSTLPRRERRSIFFNYIAFTNDFNPRSREGSDRAHSDCCKRCKISIHAPAKGATNAKGAKLTVTDISIHAPAKGATLRPQQNVSCFQHFNPRSREGSDVPALLRSCLIQDFNPRSREGSDVL